MLPLSLHRHRRARNTGTTHAPTLSTRGGRRHRDIFTFRECNYDIFLPHIRTERRNTEQLARRHRESPDFTETFENGFTDSESLLNQTIGGGSLTIGGTDASIEEGAGSIGGSNPIGNFALESIEGDIVSLTLTFTSSVEYLSFYFIDGLPGKVDVDSINGTATFATPETAVDGDSAEFFAIIADSSDEYITKVSFRDINGSAGYAVDNLSWGSGVPASGPATFPLLAAGLMLIGWSARRKLAA